MKCETRYLNRRLVLFVQQISLFPLSLALGYAQQWTKLDEAVAKNFKGGYALLWPARANYYPGLMLRKNGSMFATFKDVWGAKTKSEEIFERDPAFFAISGSAELGATAAIPLPWLEETGVKASALVANFRQVDFKLIGLEALTLSDFRLARLVKEGRANVGCGDNRYVIQLVYQARGITFTFHRRAGIGAGIGKGDLAKDLGLDELATDGQASDKAKGTEKAKPFTPVSGVGGKVRVRNDETLEATFDQPLSIVIPHVKGGLFGLAEKPSITKFSCPNVAEWKKTGQPIAIKRSVDVDTVNPDETRAVLPHILH